MSTEANGVEKTLQDQLDAFGAVELRIAPLALLHWYLLLIAGVGALVYGGPPVDMGSTLVFYASVGLIMLALGAVVYNRYAFRYVIEPDRVWVRHGLLWQSISQVQSSHVRSINVSRNPIGLLLNFGNLAFASSGTQEPEVVFRSIRSPVATKRFASALAERPASTDDGAASID